MPSKLLEISKETLSQLLTKKQIHFYLELKDTWSKFNLWLKRTFHDIFSLYKDFKGAATSLEQCGSVLKGIGTTCENLDRL